MDALQERPVTVDAVARRTLSTMVGLPGVHRAGLAIAEGAGRRLRFTSSDRQGEVVDWCYIDAYDDVPLTMVMRSRRTIAGTLGELRERFPAFVAKQDGGSTVAVVATPLASGDRVLGGVVAYFDDTVPLGSGWAAAVLDAARRAGDELVRAWSAGRAEAAYSEATGGSDLVTRLRVDDAASVGAARRSLLDLLTARAVEPDTADNAVLCLSEVLTNAVMHTSAPADVTVSVEEDRLLVAVRDAGSQLGHRPGVLEPDEPLPVNGRGLQIVDALSTRWGSESDAAGTTVWFVLELASQ